MDSKKLRNEYMKNWRKKNKEKVKEINKRYWEKKAFINCDSIDTLLEVKELEKMPVGEVKNKIDKLIKVYEEQSQKEEKEIRRLKNMIEIRIKFEEVQKLMEDVEGI